MSLPENFDWQYYIRITPKLANTTINNAKAAIDHYLKNKKNSLTYLNPNVTIRSKRKFEKILNGEINYGNGRNYIINKKDKLLFLWTPRAACSVACQVAFESMGLLKEALDYDSFIHNYRMKIYLTKMPHIPIEIEMSNIIYDKEYVIIKVVRNPYARIISCWHHLVFSFQKNNFTFREFLYNLDKNNLQFIVNGKNDPIITNHSIPQFNKGEKLYIDYYVKIENPQPTVDKIKQEIGLTLDYHKTSCHHTVKTKYDSGQCLADIPIHSIENKMPTDYKLFYDNETKKLVEKLYQNDIIEYGYTFDEKW